MNDMRVQEEIYYINRAAVAWEAMHFERPEVIVMPMDMLRRLEEGMMGVTLYFEDRPGSVRSERRLLGMRVYPGLDMEDGKIILGREYDIRAMREGKA